MEYGGPFRAPKFEIYSSCGGFAIVKNVLLRIAAELRRPFRSRKAGETGSF